MTKYEHIFFDLDHTLWDFETNSRQTLDEIFHHFDLQSFGIPTFAEFLTEYEAINADLWHQYAQKKIDKLTLRNTRFKRVLKHWQINDAEIAIEINDFYLHESPRKTALIPNTLSTLNYLKEKYALHLITNGFKEVQGTKLEGSGLLPYFENITTSEETGFLKPDSRVFEIALRDAGAKKYHSIYIGDHYESDVLGSKNAGLDQVFFNPKKQIIPITPTFNIVDLAELRVIF